MFDGETTTSNPVLEYIEGRSAELVREASMDTFHRMRVTERLFRTEHRMDPSIANDREALTSWAKTVVRERDEIRQEEADMHPGDTQKGKSVDVQIWQEPFDMSQPVIDDGVTWYLEMKKVIKEEDGSVARNLEDLNANLYRCGSKEGMQLLVDPGTKKFSELVLDLASYKYLTPEQVAMRKEMTSDVSNEESPPPGGHELNEFMHNRNQKSEEELGRFKESVANLGGEFDRVYSNRVNIPQSEAPTEK